MSKSKECINFMIDIETLGKTPGSAILSIGAIAFDIETGCPIDRKYIDFYYVVSLDSCLRAGLKVDASTILWWMDNDQQEARDDIMKDMVDENNVSTIEVALTDLGGYIELHTEEHDKMIWANPPTFDLMILESAYDLFNINVPWKHYEMMDLRTLKKFYTGPKPKFDIGEGVKHNALYDAKLQAKICSHIWKWIKEINGE